MRQQRLVSWLVLVSTLEGLVQSQPPPKGAWPMEDRIASMDIAWKQAQQAAEPYMAADSGGALNAEACGKLVDDFVADQKEREAARAKVDQMNLAFFLHVPRTAGRVVHRCVLRMGFADRCPKSYDALRVNFSSSDASTTCGLFVSHQDFRLVDLASQHGRPWIVTMFRDPIERVLSSYEFAVEVAARRLGAGVLCDPRKVCTRDVWPWNHLVPHFDNDMNTTEKVSRRDTRYARQNQEDEYEEEAAQGSDSTCKADGTCDQPKVAAAVQEGREEDKLADAHDGPRDPYNCSMMQPLHEFLETDRAQDLLPNTATFQLLGLTELTPLLQPDGPRSTEMHEFKELFATAKVAAQLRRCTRVHPESTTKLLDHALHRLESEVDVLMLHERLDDSVSTAVTVLTMRDRKVGKILGPRFQQCVTNQTSKMQGREAKGMSNLLWPDGSQLSHDKAARSKISEAIRNKIKAENWMDVKLHARATELFEKKFNELESSGNLLKVRRSVVKDL
eukprot:TRINITY_DN9500_c0_g1_i1.p1 TRINITY_DN9500_c0_g1~~TRINITY_DN9500_c0_g1_i1.p1  ORF type:complete len:505 (+),score=95.40 TRINITY_DN9500_c0_g1_i1:103-1617(+)